MELEEENEFYLELKPERARLSKGDQIIDISRTGAVGCNNRAVAYSVADVSRT